MLSTQKDTLAARFDAAAAALARSRDLPSEHLPAAALDRPKQTAHGDLACNLALQVAKPLGMNPREVASALVEQVRAADAASGSPMIDGLEIAGPGFINIRLSHGARMAAVRAVHEQAEHFGRSDRGGHHRVVVEFVSANPTGPLHVGHGRQGALGDALANLLAANGWRVTREFYYNDAGAQINNLALSVQARARGLSPDDEAFPKDGYRGDYIAEIARAFLERRHVRAVHVAPVEASGDPEDLEGIRRFAVATLRHEQDLDLRAFGVHFDNFYLESSLYTDGRVERAVAAIGAAGHSYEADGALWLRSTEWGDDKDRVMRKSDGAFTYFVPDVAYHITKWERGFAKAINVQGSDHHGTIARVRAGLQACGVGVTPGYPDYVLHKMVTVMRGGEEVKISKRAGSYVTLRDLIEWSGGMSQEGALPSSTDPRIVRGRDAVRFFLISRKADTEFVFDVDLALSQSDENPVYYVQYAHARICSVLAQALAQGGPGEEALRERLIDGSDDPLARLTLPREVALAARLAQFPELVAQACDELAPHAIAFYLRELAAELHGYYNAERFLVEDASMRDARLTLLLAVRQVLRNALALIGVSAPERM